MPTKKVKSAIRMVVITGLAILVGYAIGKLHSSSDII